MVKSIPDAKRSDRFYTSIRLPRELWDQAGFGPEDRLLLDWSGKTLTIERAPGGWGEAESDREYLCGASVLEAREPEPRPAESHRR